jgi:hypothetical protein
MNFEVWNYKKLVNIVICCKEENVQKLVRLGNMNVLVKLLSLNLISIMMRMTIQENKNKNKSLGD